MNAEKARIISECIMGGTYSPTEEELANPSVWGPRLWQALRETLGYGETETIEGVTIGADDLVEYLEELQGAKGGE